jgi:hypothetical protein
VLKKRAFKLKNVLTLQEAFPQSRDRLNEAVQNLSALRAAITDDSEADGSKQPQAGGSKPPQTNESEVAKAIKMTTQRKQLLKLLGVEVEDKDRPWWKEISHSLQTMTIKWFPPAKRVIRLLNRDWIMATLASAHLTLFAAFGVWVWTTIDHFGDCENLTTRITILPRVNIRVTSPLRIWFIVLYIICLIPFLNIVIIGALELLAIYVVTWIFSFWPREKTQLQEKTRSQENIKQLGGFIVLTFLVQVYFIVTTELTIRANRTLLVDSSQEGDWTFGQTLAVALVAIPLIDVVTQIREERKAMWDIIKRLWSIVIGLGRRLFQRRGKHYGTVLHDLFSYPQSQFRIRSTRQSNLHSSYCVLLHCY